VAIAARCAEVGFPFVLVALAAGGALTVVSIRMIGEASIATGLWSFEDICDELFHPSLSIVTGLIQSSNCLGAAAAYLIICGQIFLVLTGAGEELFAPFVVMAGVFICLPMALARHVTFLRYVSVLSVAGLVFLVGAVAYILLRYGLDDTVNASAISHGDGRANLFVHMNCLNLVVFAYNNQFNVPQLTGELRPLGKEQVSKMATLSTVSVFILYVVVALLGLLAFGVGDRQLETLVLSVRPHAGSPVVVAALMMVMFSTLMCFEFHIYPIRQFLAYAVRKVRGRSAGDEDSDEKIWSVSVTRWLDVFLCYSCGCNFNCSRGFFQEAEDNLGFRRCFRGRVHFLRGPAVVDLEAPLPAPLRPLRRHLVRVCQPLLGRPGHRCVFVLFRNICGDRCLEPR